MHLAAQQGNAEVAAVLRAAGAAVDVVNTHGNTPLFVAVFHSQGRGDIIEMLREHGANPRKANTSGVTPVELARLIANHDVQRFFADLDW